MKTINFFAGPAILAKEVLVEAQQGIEDFMGMGLSVLEISHRSSQFISVLEEAESLVRQILDVSDDYGVLFLSGGASSQFFMVAMNLLNESDKAGYLDTGSWSSKAIKEAQNFGQIEIIASSKDKNYTYIPKEYQLPTDLKYLHLTSNNTIYGTQFQSFPKTSIPLVGDMSSDIFSRPINVNDFDIIYAGAQKNLGPAGTTLVIVKKSILNKVNRVLPSMLDYQTHITGGSSYNTPPVYAIYVSMLSLRWIEKSGGLLELENKNKNKAKLLYDEIDRNSFFKGTTTIEDRSLMNVCFLATDESHTSSFALAAEEAGCVGLEGHRSVGGFRASIYNAMPIEGVQRLVDVMQKFEKENA